MTLLLVNKPTFMETISLHEAKARLSGLVSEVEKSGAKIVISRYGKPVAEISPIRKRKRTQIDSKLSKVTVSRDLTAPTSDEWDNV